MQFPRELQIEVTKVVNQTRERSGWPARRTLKVLEIPPANYYRWRREGGPEGLPPPARCGSMYELLPSEREAILDYARKHPEVRHRELAWKMVDDEVTAVSPSSVYRVLGEAGLVCRWTPKRKLKGADRPRPTQPNVLWQTDIRYTQVGRRNYYLLSFLDVYSRYVVHHELLPSMDGLSVSIAAAKALAALPAGARPTIQSDHGSAFIAREFVATLSDFGAGRILIRPHTPTDNGAIERYHRTIGERIDEHDLSDSGEARTVIAGIIDHYNHRRLHAALCYLRPVDYYRGNPEALLAERRRKLVTARELRKQENLKLRQRLIPWRPEETLTYPERPCVSL